MTDNLEGLTAEQLMLRDLIYEIPDLLAEANGQGDVQFRLGVFQALSLLESYLKIFQIDQSRFARQMPDMEKWLLEQAQ